MAKIIVDGRTIQVNEQDNLLQAVLSAGLNLPYFCWHPALGSVGACRQCAVLMYRDEKDTRGRITMACLTAAKDGTRISIEAPDAREFRRRVIEWLMVNHPHDCPVCDEGGECHLQDMTVMTGHCRREYRFTKRTHRNQDLGPFVNHEMNRCIACYRCVRYYQGVAGGRDLQAFAAHDHVYFGRAGDGVLESEFSGNLVEVCPTGVFTDKTLLQHYTRKWDLMSAPSVCNHCGVGCNTLVSHRYGLVRRILNRYNHEVNGYFLCDRGRYGYEFINTPARAMAPSINSGAQHGPTDRVSALAAATTLLRGGKIIGIGSPRASLEANHLLRSLAGADLFSTGMSDLEHRLVMTAQRILHETPAKPASLRDAGEADAVLVLGEDLTNTAPMLALAIRQAVRNVPLAGALKLGIPAWNDAAVREVVQDAKGPLFIAAPAATRLDDVATELHHGDPVSIAALGRAVAAAIDAGAGLPAPSGPPRGAPPGGRPSALPEATRDLAGRIAGALKGSARPMVVAGTSLMDEHILEAAADIANALARAGVSPTIALTVPECNSLGVSLLGGSGIEETFRKAGAGAVAVILENDLYHRLPPAAVDELLAPCRGVIVLDSIEHPTAARANICLPAATYAESDGTLVSYEGRAQRYFQALIPREPIQESWRWLLQLIAAASPAARGRDASFDELSAAACDAIAGLRGKSGEIAPLSTYRVQGLKVARQPHRASGRTAMFADLTMHEPAPPADPDTPLKFSMEGVHIGMDPALIPYFWAPGWNSVQATQRYQTEVGGPLIGGDPGVRIFPGHPEGRPAYHQADGAAPPGRGEWTLVPLYHIFGSEPLSALGPGIASLAPHPYAALNRKSAAAIGAAEGTRVTVRAGAEFSLPLAIRDDMPDNTIGLPVGLRGIGGLPFGAEVSVSAEGLK
ncbi:MAG TPA: NADH-quinone oxidoreductase subunit NuoG [Bacteroidota bacterium]